MKFNRKRVVTGLAAAGLVAGALAGGGVALAATGATPAPATSTSAGPHCGAGIGHFGGMYGMWNARHQALGAGHFGAMYGMWNGQQPGLAAATYLGLSQAELRTRLQTGTSLAEIATAQGKPVSGLKDAILAAIASRINADSALTTDQKAAILAQVRSHLDAMVNMTHPAGAGIGPMGAPMRGMW